MERICPHCQAKNDSHICTTEIGAEPAPGDVMFCYYCYQVSFFTDTDQMRLPTSEEETKLADFKSVLVLTLNQTSPEEALKLFSNPIPGLV